MLSQNKPTKQKTNLTKNERVEVETRVSPQDQESGCSLALLCRLYCFPTLRKSVYYYPMPSYTLKSYAG